MAQHERAERANTSAETNVTPIIGNLGHAEATAADVGATGPAASRPLKAVRSIKQHWLEAYRDLLLEKESLRKRLSEVEDQVEARSLHLCELVKRGIAIEKGELTGRIGVRVGRRTVTKDHIIEKLGKPVYTELLNTAPKSPDKEHFDVMKKL